MDSFDLMSSDHFNVVLHPNRQHGMIFNRFDGTATTINYDDAKELSNLKLIARTYGIVGRFLEKYLVLIQSCSRIGSLFEPESKTEHDVYVINQVQVVDISNVSPLNDSNTATTASSRSNDITDSVRYDVEASSNEPNLDRLEEHELKETRECDEYSSLPITISTNSYNSAQSRAAQWNPFRFANSLKPMLPAQFLRSTLVDSNQQQATSRTDVSSGSDGSSRISSATTNIASQQQQQILDDADKRLADEMMKLFNNTNSFYFSPTLDLTNRFSRKCTKIRVKGNEPIWKTADERFFWNKQMLKDLIELSKEDPDANYFICVILQGFISIEQQSSFTILRSRHHSNQGLSAVNIHEDADDGIEFGRLAIESTDWFTSGEIGRTSKNTDTTINENHVVEASSSSAITKDYEQSLSENNYQLALISRRSVFQAGTRYRRRGCDDAGNCANFVETEQIFRSNQHFTSMVIIRGSIPLFWFQTGYNYRPPPVLSRGEEENHQAFTKHFENLFYSYQTEQIISVDCTENTGREKILHDAFRKHMDKLSEKHPKLKLIEFDFHRYCRGRQCSDSQIEHHLRACGLTEQLLKDVRYYWNDGDIVWNQEGVFRVNCLDCSDRTNVVQRNIALQILDLQLARLGIITPDTCPQDNLCRKIMQTMWSTNGNVLSTQYCGTRALFGGDGKKLTGYLRDTYSSASRYYISKFRDVYRQAAIDAMLGVESVETKNLKSGNVRDQYELLNFDSILAGRQGGAMLRDMGSRVGNRLARLRGKLGHVRPFGQIDATSLGTDAISRFRSRPSTASSYIGGAAAAGSTGRKYSHDDSEMIETGLTEGEMTIDWPTSESIENLHHHAQSSSATREDKKNISEEQKQNVFDRFSNCEDCFQDDDDFGQLMDDY